jgi:ABC-type lipoprotein release transport system permease subunit
MTSNIHEQSKEIAILRALGISRAWMYRIYIYESFILVLSSSILGIAIGMIF